MFATIFIGIFGNQDGSLSYINGGHEPPILMQKNGTVTRLTPSGPAIGIIPDADFSVREIKMDADDLLLAFTDGIPDALNSDEVPFGSPRLLAIVQGMKATPRELLENIEGQLKQFIGTTDPFDDVTMVAVKRSNLS